MATPRRTRIRPELVADPLGDAIEQSERMADFLKFDARRDEAEAVAKSVALPTYIYQGRALKLGTVRTYQQAKQRIEYRSKAGMTQAARYTAFASIRTVVEGGLANGTDDLVAQLNTVFENFGRLANQRQGIRAKMDRVALSARNATYNSYQTKVYATGRNTTYRSGLDRLVGALGNALQRPGWAFGTADGVVFGDYGILDAEAAHWHRMNFGAGARGKETSPRTGPMYFSLDPRASGEQGTKVIDQFGIVEPPSPAFLIPPGVFVGPQGGILNRTEARGDPFYTRRQYIKEFSDIGGLNIPQKAEHAFSGPWRGRRKTHFFNPISNKAQSVAVGKMFTRDARSTVTRGIRGYQFMDAGVASIRGGAHNYSFPQACSELINQWFDDATRNRGPLRNT